jgi:hypothetical protein
VGVYWVALDGERGAPFLFQVATLGNGRIVHLQDQPTRRRALAAAKKVAEEAVPP